MPSTVVPEPGQVPAALPSDRPWAWSLRLILPVAICVKVLLVVETSMRRNLPLALAALQRREIDVALGNVSGLGKPLPAGLTASRSHLTPADLRSGELWWPTEPGSPELNRFAVAYARRSASTGERNLGLDALARRDTRRAVADHHRWSGAATTPRW